MRRELLVVTAALLAIPFAAADLMQTLRNVFDKVLQIGNLNFLGLSNDYMLLGLTRILLWIIIFAILFGLLTYLGRDGGAIRFLNRGQRLVVALAVSLISIIFIPVELLLAVGSGWATLVAFLFIGGPVVAIAYLLYRFPEGELTRGIAFIKMIVCLVLFWVLTVMRHFVAQIS